MKAINAVDIAVMSVRCAMLGIIAGGAAVIGAGCIMFTDSLAGLIVSIVAGFVVFASLFGAEKVLEKVYGGSAATALAWGTALVIAGLIGAAGYSLTLFPVWTVLGLPIGLFLALQGIRKGSRHWQQIRQAA